MSAGSGDDSGTPPLLSPLRRSPAKRGRPSKLSRMDAGELSALESSLAACQVAAKDLHAHTARFGSLDLETSAQREAQLFASITNSVGAGATWRQIAEMVDVDVSSVHTWWNRRKKMLSNTHNPVLDSDVIGTDNPT